MPPTTGSIHGKVKNEYGQSIANAHVTVTPGMTSSQTGSDGAFEFKSLNAGQYDVTVRAVDYQEDTKKVSIEAGKTKMLDFSMKLVKKLMLNCRVLNFGKDNNSLTFEIKNGGNSPFNWNISGLKGINWLEVHPTTGTLEGGRSCSVQVNLLRDNLKQNTDATLIVNSDKESESLKVTVETERDNKSISVEPSKLDFGKEESTLTFSIKNNGNTNGEKWSISGIDADWLSFSPMEGTLDAGNMHTVKATIDRDKITGTVKTTVLVNGGGNSYPLECSATQENNTSWVFTISPSSLDFGDDKTELYLDMTSQYKSTDYSFKKRGTNTGWLELSDDTGTIPIYDKDDPETRVRVKVSVNRSNLVAGIYSCILVLSKSNSETDTYIPVSMSVTEELKNEIKVQPESLDIGEDGSASFTIYSSNADASYLLLTKENVAWLSFDKNSGTVNSGSSATVNVKIKRVNLPAGNYGCTIIVRTDLGDTEIPLTMTIVNPVYTTVSGF